MKRYRSPKINDGEIKIYYGRADGDAPDVCYQWGDGASKRDGRLVMSALCSPINHYNSPRQSESVINQLIEAGYDIDTLKFSIKKKQTNPTQDEGVE